MPGFQTLRGQAKNIQRGESKDNRPEKVVHVPARTVILQGEDETEHNRDLAAHNRIGRNRGPCSPGKTRQQRNCRRQWHSRKQSGDKPLRARSQTWILPVFLWLVTKGNLVTVLIPHIPRGAGPAVRSFE